MLDSCHTTFQIKAPRGAHFSTIYFPWCLVNPQLLRILACKNSTFAVICSNVGVPTIKWSSHPNPIRCQHSSLWPCSPASHNTNSTTPVNLSVRYLPSRMVPSTLIIAPEMYRGLLMFSNHLMIIYFPNKFWYRNQLRYHLI